MIPYGQYADDPERRAAIEALAGGGGQEYAPPDVISAPSQQPANTGIVPLAPPAAGPPTPDQPPPAAGDQLPPWLSGLIPPADSPGYRPEPPPPFDLPPPPHKRQRDDTLPIAGTVLDVLLNRGRDVPQMLAQMGQEEDTPYENWKRDMEYARARYALTAPRGYGRYGYQSPEALGLRRGNLMLRYKSILDAERGQDTRVAGQKTREESLAFEKARWNEMNTPGTPTALSYEDIAVRNGIDPAVVRGKTAKQIQDLKPSINFGAQRSGNLGQMDVAHAAQKAGMEALATEPSKIRIAQAGAAANAAERGDAMERSRLATMTATRAAGEAELKAVGPRMIEMLHKRPGSQWGDMPGAALTSITPHEMALDEDAFNVLKQQAIDAGEKMITGGVPHEQAVRGLLASMPKYGSLNAEERLRRIFVAIDALGEAGTRAVQETKEAPRPVKRPQPKPGEMTPSEADELRGLGL